MAILKLARMGHPVLNRTADAIDDPTAPEIHRLIETMIARSVAEGAWRWKPAGSD